MRINFTQWLAAGLATTLALALAVPVTSKAESLLGYYPFEDNYDDSSGNGNTAIPAENIGELAFIAGFRGQSLDVNDPDSGAAVIDTGGRVDIPIDANPLSLPEVTFGGWIRVDTSEFDGFMAMDNGGWDRGITATDNQGGLGFGVASGAAPVSVGTVTPGSWQYVVATFSQATAATAIYVGNDVAGVSTTLTGAGADASIDPFGEVNIEIGRYNGQDLDAAVDDLFVFEGALTNHKVNAIRNLRLSPLDYSPADAAAIFALFDDESTGDVAGTTWSPVEGLSAGIPGSLSSLGEQGVGLVLDDLGNGMVGDIQIALDIDGDGMQDSWEQLHFMTLDNDGTADTDTDGLTDREEHDATTDPNDADSDDEGLTDGEEVKTYLTNPNNPNTDGDRFTDFEEVNASPPTDPRDPNDFPSPPPPSLLAYYAFEDNYDDSSGNDNTAVPTDNPAEINFAAGFRGRGADINDPDAAAPNTGGSINIPIDANPGVLPSVTFGGWVNVESNVFDGFMAIDNGGWDRGITVTDNAGALGFGIASGAGPTIGGDVVLGSWQYSRRHLQQAGQSHRALRRRRRRSDADDRGRHRDGSRHRPGRDQH